MKDHLIKLANERPELDLKHIARDRAQRAAPFPSRFSSGSEDRDVVIAFNPPNQIQLQFV